MILQLHNITTTKKSYLSRTHIYACIQRNKIQDIIKIRVYTHSYIHINRGVFYANIFQRISNVELKILSQYIICNESVGFPSNYTWSVACLQQEKSATKNKDNQIIYDYRSVSFAHVLYKYFFCGRQGLKISILCYSFVYSAIYIPKHTT